MWLDTDGKPIQAHSAGILYHEGTYYWYGENKNGPTKPGGCGARVDVIGVSCYASKDLYNWKNGGLALAAVTDDPKHDLHPSMVVERPKVIYNSRTRKFVMWMHIDDLDYRAARAGVAVADKPTGPFRYIGSSRPINNQTFRDMNLFLDSDGKAYVFYSSEGNATLYVARLNADFTDIERPAVEGKTWMKNFPGKSREAPAPFKHDGKYYIITSGCSGWKPNPADYAVADHVLGPYEGRGNPCVGKDSETTFGSQSSFVLPVQGSPGCFLFLADRWNIKDLGDSRYVWLPFKMKDDGTFELTWQDEWDLSVFQSRQTTQNSNPEASLPFVTPLQWKSSDVLVKPVPDATREIVSVKDPTIVRHNGLWHVYATVYSASKQTWNMVYLNFKDWSDAPHASYYHMDQNPNLAAYHCAPHVFFFRPLKKWFLIFQSQQPQFSTTDDLSKPETWSAPQDFFPGVAPDSRPWLDYWVICDDTHAYLFFTADNGNLYRSRTRIGDFPNGMSDPQIAIKEKRADLFEGSMTYKIKGSDLYLTLAEASGPKGARYYRAWTSNRLDGDWTLVRGADTFQKPFAGINNVTFEAGVAPWTREVSHGELIRDGYDETMTIDPANLQILYQGRDPSSGGTYALLPYRLGLLQCVGPGKTP